MLELSWCSRRSISGSRSGHERRRVCAGSRSSTTVPCPPPVPPPTSSPTAAPTRVGSGQGHLSTTTGHTGTTDDRWTSHRARDEPVGRRRSRRWTRRARRGLGKKTVRISGVVAGEHRHDGVDLGDEAAHNPHAGDVPDLAPDLALGGRATQPPRLVGAHQTEGTLRQRGFRSARRPKLKGGFTGVESADEQGARLVIQAEAGQPCASQSQSAVPRMWSSRCPRSS